MNMIRRNTDPMQGPPDGVAADIQCAVTTYETPKDGQRTVKGQATLPCTVYCTYSDGTVGISIRELDLQIDILVEEIMAIMQAGAEANRELTAPQGDAYTDAEIEEQWRELQTIQWDEAESPSGMILASAWWIFPRGVYRDDLYAWFGEHHSLGIEYLQKLTEGGGWRCENSKI